MIRYKLAFFFFKYKSLWWLGKVLLSEDERHFMVVELDRQGRIYEHNKND